MPSLYTFLPASSGFCLHAHARHKQLATAARTATHRPPPAALPASPHLPSTFQLALAFARLIAPAHAPPLALPCLPRNTHRCHTHTATTTLRTRALAYFATAHLPHHTPSATPPLPAHALPHYLTHHYTAAFSTTLYAHLQRYRTPASRSSRTATPPAALPLPSPACACRRYLHTRTTGNRLGRRRAGGIRRWSRRRHARLCCFLYLIRCISVGIALYCWCLARWWWVQMVRVRLYTPACLPITTYLPVILLPLPPTASYPTTPTRLPA